MDKLIEKIIFLGLGCAILFYALAYAIMPPFTDLYEHCGTNNPYSAGRSGNDLTNACCQTGSATVVTCANCNNTAGYPTFLSTCYSLIAKTNGTDCYQCASFGNKGIYQGLFFLIFLIAIFTIVLVIIYSAIKFKKR
jgi:uncharacterized membrane protein